MKINRLSLIEGARRAVGLTVIIDVFRAFTTDAYVFGNGASKVYPVVSKEQAFELKRVHPDYLLIGEINGLKIKGFDYGNSPYEVMNVDFSERIVVQRTSAGTQGILNAVNSEEILPGSFVMAEAIINYIRNKNPKVLSLVAMGWGGLERSPEDELFADYIEKRLKGINPEFEEIKQYIRIHPQGAKFFDSSQPQFVEEDFHAAMNLDRFDFCLRVIDEECPYIVKANQ
jgi:2-phosphosulfolactate phosphatase